MGATPATIRHHVLRQTIRLGVIGIAIGGLASLVISPLLKSLLYSVSANDLFTIACVSGVLLLVAALAGYIPAWRASRVHPGIVLQQS